MLQFSGLRNWKECMNQKRTYVASSFSFCSIAYVSCHEGSCCSLREPKPKVGIINRKIEEAKGKNPFPLLLLLRTSIAAAAATTLQFSPSSSSSSSIAKLLQPDLSMCVFYVLLLRIAAPVHAARSMFLFFFLHFPPFLGRSVCQPWEPGGEGRLRPQGPQPASQPVSQPRKGGGKGVSVRSSRWVAGRGIFVHS